MIQDFEGMPTLFPQKMDLEMVVEVKVVEIDFEGDDNSRNFENSENFAFGVESKNFLKLVDAKIDWDDSSIPGYMY